MTKSRSNYEKIPYRVERGGARPSEGHVLGDGRRGIIYQGLKENKKFQENPGNIFNPFFDSIADAVLKEIEDDVENEAEAGSWPDWLPVGKILDLGVLKEILIKVSKRILIYDMNVRRENGKLAGGSEEEEYVDYVCHHLMQPEYVQCLFQRYPVWEKTMSESIGFYIRNMREVLHHLNSDKKCLNEEFFPEKPFNRVIRISGSGSDTHCENRVVYCVELDNGQCIYHKSRVNTGIRFFNELYVRIGSSCGTPAYINPILERDAYVWEKEASYRECQSEQQVRNYFTRLGMILCICHLCHSGDMHYENIVACGEYPVIIDYETLVQPPPEQRAEDAKGTNALIGMSVLPIGILPFYGARNKNFNADFSGLCGGEKQMMDLKIPVIANPGKSTMCIAYKYGETQEKNNRVRLNGQVVVPGEYLSNIYAGFETGYRYICENKEQIAQLAQGMRESLFRQLFRNTQEYHMILDLSYHPQFMEKEGMRRIFLENALSIPEFKEKLWIVEQEIEDMLNGDIPYFQFHMASGLIYNSHRRPLRTVFQRTGMEFIEKQIKKRSIKDMEIQKQLIQVSLNYSRVQYLNQCMSTISANKEKNISISQLCLKIADVIYEHHIDVSGRIRWINTRIMSANVDKRYTYYMEMSDRYLYEGITGMAVFAAALLKYFPEHRLSEIYSRIINELFAYTDQMFEDGEKGSSEEKMTTGIFFGEGSIVYGYQLLYQITKNVTFLKYGAKHCEILRRCLKEDEQFDIVGGNAGAVMVFLNMYDLQREDCYLEMAERAAGVLLKKAVAGETGIGWKNISNGTLLGGFAHGCAGIMYALSRLSAYTGKKEYLEAAYQAFLYERTLYCPEKGGWRDLRSEEELYMSDFKWCHGTAGILFGWKLSLPYFEGIQKETVSREIKRLMEDYPQVLIKEEVGLCHGNLGNAMIGHCVESDSWKASSQENVLKSVEILHEIFISKEGKAGLHEQYDYSLMTGLAGAGYGLLYCLHQDLPGILDLRL
ncbi:type 2 lanthipeptide synthetase LanM [Frisingicoccus sp.]|uniref:type 2 lanthipeptide synthetase LanM n=1 Tax=Frisingicoccus sp. TaxID=1918627 RepID=UPI003AB4BFEB